MANLFTFDLSTFIEYTEAVLADPSEVLVDSIGVATLDGYALASDVATLATLEPSSLDGFVVFEPTAFSTFDPATLDGWEISTMTTSYPRATQIRRIPKDSLETIVMTFRDEDGSAKDVSTETTILFHCSSDGVAVTSGASGSFVTDGTDGKVQFTLTATEAGTIRRLACEFELDALDLVSEMFVLEILERAKV